MLLAYLDESYSKPEVYWLGAALVPERAIDALGREYRRIPATIPRDLGVPSDAGAEAAAWQVHAVAAGCAQ